MNLPVEVLRSALDDANVAVVTIDERGRIETANVATEALFGHAVGDLVGRNVSCLMGGHHARHHDEYLRRYLRTGVPGVIGRTRKTTAVRANGDSFPIHLSVGEHREAGVSRFVGIIFDISEYERRLARATRFGRIIKESGDSVVVCSRDTLRLTMANDEAILRFELDRDRLEQYALSDLGFGLSVERFHELLAPLKYEAPERVALSVTLQQDSAESIDMELSFSVSDAVSPPEIVMIGRDVTELKQLETSLKRARMLESVGQLSAGLAHDFNNLLGVVSGNLEMLSDEMENDPRRRYIDESLDAIAFGTRLTTRLRVAMQRVTLEPKPHDVNAIVIGLVEMLRPALGSGVTLHTRLPPKLPPVTVDRSQLENALVNMAVNAREAMSGRGTVTMCTGVREFDHRSVEVGSTIAPGRYVTISVSDTGPGLDRDARERVFDPFYTTKEEGGGTGLGLAMVQAFVTQSGGVVWVDDTPEGGARFTMLLPANGKGDEPAASVDSGEASTLAAKRALLVMLVDDVDALRTITAARLRRLGHEVIELTSADAALERLERSPLPTLLITDYRMPGRYSGHDLAIRAAALQIPTVVVSADGQTLDRQQMAPAGVSALVVLAKPFDSAGLVHAIEQALGESVPSTRTGPHRDH